MLSAVRIVTVFLTIEMILMLYVKCLQAFACLSMLMLCICTTTIEPINNEMNQMNNQTSEHPYREVEVSYKNKSSGITLSGTLTMPSTEGPFPVALLIAGMGPIDRDGTNYYGHKPSLALAHHLGCQGIATLRVDKRGVGHSTGTFDQRLTTYRDFADDVLVGIEYLKTCKEINPKSIGLIGHSEGGLVATIVAANSPDVAFVVLLAGAIVNDTQSLVEQTAIQLRADGASEEMVRQDGLLRTQMLETIKHEDSIEKAENRLQELFVQYWTNLQEDQKQESENILFAISQAKFDSRIKFMNSIYYRFMLTYDSLSVLSQIKIPILVIYGELDFMAPHIILPLIRKAIQQAGNKSNAVLELPKLNHSLQTGKTGSMAEYATIKEAIAPMALSVISDWIVAQMGK